MIRAGMLCSLLKQDDNALDDRLKPLTKRLILHLLRERRVSEADELLVLTDVFFDSHDLADRHLLASPEEERLVWAVSTIRGKDVRDSPQYFSQFFVLLVGRETEELCLSTKNIGPCEILPDQEAGVDSENVSLSSVRRVEKGQDSLIGNIEEARLEVTGCEAERIAIFRDQFLGF